MRPANNFVVTQNKNVFRTKMFIAFFSRLLLLDDQQRNQKIHFHVQLLMALPHLIKEIYCFIKSKNKFYQYSYRNIVQ